MDFILGFIHIFDLGLVRRFYSVSLHCYWTNVIPICRSSQSKLNFVVFYFAFLLLFLSSSFFVFNSINTHLIQLSPIKLCLRFYLPIFLSRHSDNSYQATTHINLKKPPLGSRDNSYQLRKSVNSYQVC